MSENAAGTNDTEWQSQKRCKAIDEWRRRGRRESYVFEYAMHIIGAEAFSIRYARANKVK